MKVIVKLKKDNKLIELISGTKVKGKFKVFETDDWGDIIDEDIYTTENFEGELIYCNIQLCWMLLHNEEDPYSDIIDDRFSVYYHGYKRKKRFYLRDGDTLCNNRMEITSADINHLNDKYIHSLVVTDNNKGGYYYRVTKYKIKDNHVVDSHYTNLFSWVKHPDCCGSKLLYGFCSSYEVKSGKYKDLTIRDYDMIKLVLAVQNKAAKLVHLSHKQRAAHAFVKDLGFEPQFKYQNPNSSNTITVFHLYDVITNPESPSALIESIALEG